MIKQGSAGWGARMKVRLLQAGANCDLPVAPAPLQHPAESGLVGRPLLLRLRRLHGPWWRFWYYGILRFLGGEKCRLGCTHCEAGAM